MTLDRDVYRLPQWFEEHMDPDLADARMWSMPPVEWTELGTKDDLAQLEARLRAHTELTAARSMRTTVYAVLGAAVTNVASLLTALNVG